MRAKCFGASLMPRRPHAGAWIETVGSRCIGRSDLRPVAPNAGAWIETIDRGQCRRHGSSGTQSPPTRGRGLKLRLPRRLRRPNRGQSPPTRGRGLKRPKPVGTPSRARRGRSHAGAWIETITLDAASVASLAQVAPTRGRGLKLFGLGAPFAAAGRRPHAGAWIETYRRSETRLGRRASPPTRGRGLKPQSGGQVQQVVGRPHAGAWIETPASPRSLTAAGSSPGTRGAWIETSRTDLGPGWRWSPPRGGVD